MTLQINKARMLILTVGKEGLKDCFDGGGDLDIN